MVTATNSKLTAPINFNAETDWIKNNENNPHWIIIPTQGASPGKRYGHTIVFFKPFLIIFGGNTGTIPVNDVWILNVEKAPYLW